MQDIHGEWDHFDCPDPYCCSCDCRACKRAWFALGRPTSKDCPKHGPALQKPAPKPMPKTLTRAQMQTAAEKVTWHGSKTDFVTDLLHELGLPDTFQVG